MNDTHESITAVDNNGDNNGHIEVDLFAIEDDGVYLEVVDTSGPGDTTVRAIVILNAEAARSVGSALINAAGQMERG